MTMVRSAPRAVGSFEKEGKRKMAIVFDEDMFKKISDEAFRHNRPFAEQLRIYVVAGMELEAALKC